MAISALRAASAGNTSTASNPGAPVRAAFRFLFLVGFFAAVTVLASGCAGGSDPANGSATAASSGPTDAAGALAPEDQDEDEGEGSAAVPAASARDQQRPGAGRTLKLARGEEFDTWFPAAVYERLLAELGYAVTVPADTVPAELGAEAAFAAVARGQADFWTSALFPLHEPLFDNQLDGEAIRGRAIPLGVQSPSGVMEGVLASRDWVVANGIFHLDDLSAAPNAADFDVDGNGVPDIYGCRVGTICSAVLDRLILTNGWNIEQITAGADSILDAAIARVAAGEPTLVYGWTPSAVVAALQPGENVVWMSVREPNPDWSNEATGTTPQECPARPCMTGFGASDVRVVANADFVDREPVAAALIEAVRIPATDVAVQNSQLSQITGIGTELDPGDIRTLELEVDRLASEWISAHRGDVGAWLDLARSAR